MTGFELYAMSKGFNLIAGDGTYNTYNNCSNGYKHPDGRYFSIGLYGCPTRIGMITNVKVNGKRFIEIPTEDIYDEILNQLDSK
jgi:hypothetical protein